MVKKFHKHQKVHEDKIAKHLFHLLVLLLLLFLPHLLLVAVTCQDSRLCAVCMQIALHQRQGLSGSHFGSDLTSYQFGPACTKRDLQPVTILFSQTSKMKTRIDLHPGHG